MSEDGMAEDAEEADEEDAGYTHESPANSPAKKRRRLRSRIQKESITLMRRHYSANYYIRFAPRVNGQPALWDSGSYYQREWW